MSFGEMVFISISIGGRTSQEITQLPLFLSPIPVPPSGALMFTLLLQLPTAAAY
jgi:hypothetical protein